MSHSLLSEAYCPEDFLQNNWVTWMNVAICTRNFLESFRVWDCLGVIIRSLLYNRGMLLAWRSYGREGVVGWSGDTDILYSSGGSPLVSPGVLPEMPNIALFMPEFRGNNQSISVPAMSKIGVLMPRTGVQHTVHGDEKRGFFFFFRCARANVSDLGYTSFPK